MSLDHLWAGWRSEYIEATARPADGQCLFCALQHLDDTEGMILERTDLTFTVMNAYPYTSGHVMVAPTRHEAMLTGLDPAEATAVMHAVQRASGALEVAYRPQGQNVGLNLGRAGGAGVPDHLHAHVLPRWSGDTNFTTSVAETRVLPEPLRASYDKLVAVWPR